MERMGVHNIYSLKANIHLISVLLYFVVRSRNSLFFLMKSLDNFLVLNYVYFT